MKRILSSLALLIAAALVVGCSAVNTSSPQTGNPIRATKPTMSSNSNAASEFQPQTVEGGSVTVTVTPLSMKAGARPEFDISMNTHSVDLAYDMTKSVVLRDDTGKEYLPLTWEGPSEGGHHRAGTLKFEPLAKTKSITLIVRDVAGVSERIFKWDVP